MSALTRKQLATAVFPVTMLVMSMSVADAGKQSTAVSVSPEKANQLIQQGAVDLILDVRTQEEFTSPLGHLEGARLIPVQELPQRMHEIEAYKDKTILVYCHSGIRSDFAAGLFKKNGFTNVLNLDGGIVQWKSKKLKTVTGPARTKTGQPAPGR